MISLSALRTRESRRKREGKEESAKERRTCDRGWSRPRLSPLSLAKRNRSRACLVHGIHCVDTSPRRVGLCNILSDRAKTPGILGEAARRASGEGIGAFGPHRPPDAT
jgi:hypothetical protein